MTGALVSLASIVLLVTISSTMQIDRVSRWIVLPTASCAVIAWFTAGRAPAIQRKQLAQRLVE